MSTLILRQMVREASDRTGLSPDLIMSSRARKYYYVRRDIMRQLRSERRYTSGQIARLFDRHPTTVMNALGMLSKSK